MLTVDETALLRVVW